jgi:hypothetical protein
MCSCGAFKCRQPRGPRCPLEQIILERDQLESFNIKRGARANFRRWMCHLPACQSDRRGGSRRSGAHSRLGHSMSMPGRRSHGSHATGGRGGACLPRAGPCPWAVPGTSCRWAGRGRRLAGPWNRGDGRQWGTATVRDVPAPPSCWRGQAGSFGPGPRGPCCRICATPKLAWPCQGAWRAT